MTTPSNPDTAVDHEHIRTGMSAESLKKAFLDNIFYLQGRYWEASSLHDRYMAGAYTIRDRILQRWVKSAQTYFNEEVRTVCYFSAEYLLGPHLANNILNLGITDAVRQAATELKIKAGEILDQEEEPGLGNGGLGRLAACYMDSLATLQIPAIGYGIRYEFGIFEQTIQDGWQKEHSDHWLRNGNPWELLKPDLKYPVKFGGHTEHYTDHHGQLKVNWIPGLVINGVAYDTPISGFDVCNTNLLRLWSSHAASSFDFEAFNTGDYYRAVEAKVVAENISKVLYPNDEPEAGKELRLQQQYFFVSCSLQDMLRLHLRSHNSPEGFDKKFAVQLNDTHPAIAVPELMRLLIDEYDMEWEKAWDITSNTFAYTNHTLLPEALETWSVEILGKLLPRHLEIIYEINRRFLDDVRMRFIMDLNHERVDRLSLIGGHAENKVVRMANLATVGSFSVNGVAELHTDLLKSTVMKDFNELWPEKFHNVTNGVTPRRFICLSNPDLTELISQNLGNSWITQLDQLQELESCCDDSSFHEAWQAVKLKAKQRLANRIQEKTGISVDPSTLFDVQVKRIHEYKRQHLNLLHIVTLYERIKQNPNIEMVPRTFIFGGKAAPGYYMAKLIIKLINSVAEVINRDPQINHLLRVVFYPDFSVKSGQFVYPAADLSEQISTAGKEASGTGNMKFAMNGALTIGTLDGANVEIRQAVGEENFFLFGLNADEVVRARVEDYRPWDIYHNNHELKAAIDLINSGIFSHGDTELFRPLTDSLLSYDPYMLLADYQSYLDCQTAVDHAYCDTEHWTRMSILNVARIGKFSSDRAIREYAEKIWKVKPVPVYL
jgi:starch phosphorylase